MSLEQELAENTAAVKELVAVWKQLTAQAKTIDGTKPFKAAGISVVEAKIEAPKPVAAVTPAPTPVAAEAVTIASPEIVKESPSEITYEDVSKAVLAKMKTDRAAVMAAAAKFSVKNAKELKPEQWADFMVEIA